MDVPQLSDPNLPTGNVPSESKEPQAPFVPHASRVRFVLVAPAHAGNIGSAARAIRTMGFERLVVVAPRIVDFQAHPEAVAYATHAVDVLRAATVAPDLVTAVRGATRAFAMSGYAREFGPPLQPLREAAGVTRAVVNDGFEVAFVFGGERNGLANEDIERCTDTCAIPADPARASLNLSQAVQITAYELQLALRGSTSIAPVLQPFADETPAGVEQTDGVVAHWMRALEAIGYVDPATPGRLESRLRRLFGRARPSASDVDILRGIAAAMIERKSNRIGSRRR